MDILDMIETGNANVALHDESRYLRSAAEAFLAVYDDHRGYSVVASSPQAERVLGAIMIMRPEVNAAGQGKTLILDVNVASGTLMARAARRLRDCGNASPLVGVVLHSLVGDRSHWDIDGLNELLVVSPLSLASRVGQPAESSNSRVQLAG